MSSDARGRAESKAREIMANFVASAKVGRDFDLVLQDIAAALQRERREALEEYSGMTFDQWSEQAHINIFQEGVGLMLDSLDVRRVMRTCWNISRLTARRETIDAAINAVRDAGGDNEDYHAAAIERLRDAP